MPENTIETNIQMNDGLTIAYIIISALVVIMGIAAFVMRIITYRRYFKYNKIIISGNRTSYQVAREALDKAGLSYVQIKKARLLRAMIWGNSYSISKKTIFLRRTVYDKNSITAVGMALQKVGVAKMILGDSKSAKIRNFMQIVSLFGPFLFLPTIIAGVAIDIVVFSTIGVFSILGIVLGLVFVSSGFVVTLLNIPVEKKANKICYDLLKELDVTTPEETEQIKTVLETYIITYIMEFIVAVLRIVQLILEIAIRARGSNNN